MKTKSSIFSLTVDLTVSNSTGATNKSSGRGGSRLWVKFCVARTVLRRGRAWTASSIFSTSDTSRAGPLALIAKRPTRSTVKPICFSRSTHFTTASGLGRNSSMSTPCNRPRNAWTGLSDLVFGAIVKQTRSHSASVCFVSSADAATKFSRPGASDIP